jgi:tRNA nucleotidyltransferase (CCA-adding enzyme)
MMTFNLPQNVLYILNKLEEAGYRADIVGGCVRDFLLERVPNDFDITTAATPDKIQSVFGAYRTLNTGIKHGTVTLLLDATPYEITTYRVDGEYRDSRHPESVTFTADIRDDLCRRDFTMNAIAYSPKHGLTDLFGGEADARAGIVRAVGDADLRFTEDALRILRGMRFASTFDFSVEAECRAAMLDKADLIRNVSVERILTELKKLLEGEGSYRIITEFSPIIDLIIPELAPLRMPCADLWRRLDGTGRLVSMFACCEKGRSFGKVMRRLHADKKTIDFGECVLSLMDKLPENTDRASLGEYSILAEPEALLLALKIGVYSGKAIPEAYDALRCLLSEKRPRAVGDLAVNGEDLKARGLSGAAIGNAMRLLLRAVAREEIKNEREELLSYLRLI